MYWSAALQLKQAQAQPQAPPPRSYGSFSRSASGGSLHIPPSIPEHQCFDPQPVPVEPMRPIDLSTKLLRLQRLAKQPLPTRVVGEKARLLPARAAADDASVAYSTPSKQLTDQHAANPQEYELEAEEHNYWVQERERRRLGLQKSRRRTCTPLSERAPTSNLKLGVVMCSVPLVLVLVFVIFVLALGRGAGTSSPANSLLSVVWGDPDAPEGQNEPPTAVLWHAVVRQWNDSVGALDAFPRASWALRGAGR